MRNRPKILLGKVGLDGHSRGVQVVARALRDAGMEVVYTGLRQTPEAIVEAAIQEDVDVVGFSILSGSYMTHLPRIIELLRERGMGDKLVIAGGVFDFCDIPKLKQSGVAEIFTSGSTFEEIVSFIESKVPARS